jgi:hypothetical protein
MNPETSKRAERGQQQPCRFRQDASSGRALTFTSGLDPLLPATPMEQHSMGKRETAITRIHRLFFPAEVHEAAPSLQLRPDVRVALERRRDLARSWSGKLACGARP